MEILGIIEEVPLAGCAHPRTTSSSVRLGRRLVRVAEGFDSKSGQWEPIVAKFDGTVLSGHSRLRALSALKLPFALVRQACVDSYREELEILIRSNTDRRQMSPRQIAFAFKRLKETAKRTEARSGRWAGRRRAKKKSGRNRTLEAETLPRRRCSVLAPTRLALSNPSSQRPCPRGHQGGCRFRQAGADDRGEGHRDREAAGWRNQRGVRARVVGREQGAKKGDRAPDDRSVGARSASATRQKLKAAMGQLFEAYKDFNGALSEMPLSRVLQIRDHNAYLGLIRETSPSARGERSESVNGDGEKTRQLTLVKG